MDITRQLSLPSQSERPLAGESEAVAVLHKSLVSLRQELVKRDQQIYDLQLKLNATQEETNGHGFQNGSGLKVRV